MRFKNHEKKFFFHPPKILESEHGKKISGDRGGVKKISLVPAAALKNI